MVLQGQDIELITGENNKIIEIHLTADTGGPLILTGTALTWKLVDQNGVTQVTKSATVINDGTEGSPVFSIVQIILLKADTISANLNLTHTHELWEVKSDSTELLLSEGNVTFFQGHPP